MDLLGFMMKLDIKYYLELKNMIPVSVGLNTFKVKKVVLCMSFLIVIEEKMLIHTILCH